MIEQYKGFRIEIVAFQDRKNLFLVTINLVPLYKNYATIAKALVEAKKLIDGYPENNR